jgi:hypothetical protein
MEDTNTSVSGSVDVATPIQESNTATQSNTSSGEFNFRDHISDEFKSSKTLEQYKDLNGLVKSHIELNKMLGDRVKLPSENSTPEEINKFYAKLGRPEAMDKYEFKNPEQLPEGFQLNEAGTTKFKELAFKLGLTQKQANELRGYYVNEAIEQHKSTYVSKEKMEEEFVNKGKEKFGDKYDNVINNASKVMKENLSEEQRASLDKMDNEQLLAVSELINNLSNKYIKQDTIDNNYKPANTLDDQKNELTKLLEKQKTLNAFSPDWDTTNKRIKDLYAKGVKKY